MPSNASEGEGSLCWSACLQLLISTVEAQVRLFYKFERDMSQVKARRTGFAFTLNVEKTALRL